MRWNRRRQEKQSRFGPADRRWLLRILGIGTVAFALGYLLTALLFFRSTDRPPVVAVPDLRDQTVPAATRLTRAQGLELAVGDSLPNPEVAAGRILTQSPLPGQEVAPGSPVRVILSVGPARRPVPTVAALSQEQATRLLSAAGFRVQLRTLPHPEPAGQVVGVEPAPGSLVRVPGDVTLLLSEGPPLVAVPDVLGLSEAQAALALEAAGLRMTEVDYQHLGPGTVESVVAQRPLPGDSIRQGEGVRLVIVTDRVLGEPIR